MFVAATLVGKKLSALLSLPWGLRHISKTLWLVETSYLWVGTGYIAVHFHNPHEENTNHPPLTDIYDITMI